jgi:sporulation protein YlmC with PRC-barrel domain
MNAKELFDREVLDADAKTIGKVIDIGFDIQQGVITHIVVRGGLVKEYDVGFDAIARIGDRIILKIAEDELKRKTVIRM